MLTTTLKWLSRTEGCFKTICHVSWFGRKSHDRGDLPRRWVRQYQWLQGTSTIIPISISSKQTAHSFSLSRLTLSASSASNLLRSAASANIALCRASWSSCSLSNLSLSSALSLSRSSLASFNASLCCSSRSLRSLLTSANQLS